LDAAARRLEREHNDRAWLAWHIVAMDRAKRLPKLKTLLAKSTTRSRQSWQEQLRIMDMWVAVTQRMNFPTRKET